MGTIGGGSSVIEPWNTNVIDTTTLTNTMPTRIESVEEWEELVSKIEGIRKEDFPKVDISKETDAACRGCRYRVTCSDMEDLSQDRILKNLSIMKSRLMMECSPVLVKRVECKMTPEVKKNIIQAFRKINMYGKKTPFVARFDEYGRRLEDDVKIDTLEGMIISIVDPEDYGPLYLEFTGVIEDLFYQPRRENPYKID